MGRTIIRMINGSAVLLAIGLALLYKYQFDWIRFLCREDGPLESLSALFYLAASILFLISNRKHHFRNIWMWGYALLFFIIFGEEISWGQRIFALVSPEFFHKYNVQQELNLHNIHFGIHNNVRAAALLIISIICYVIPITNALFSRCQKVYRRIQMPIFPIHFILLPTIAILFMLIPRLIFQTGYFRLDEMGEFFLSVGFLLFAIDTVKNQ